MSFYDGKADYSANRPKDLAQISQVAHMYYDLNMSQPEISKKLFFSRSKVSRMLEKARALSIVEIKVKRVFDRASSIEDELKSRFNLKEAIVITSYDEIENEALNAVTDYAAEYVSNIIKGDCFIGISRGNTIIQVINKLTKIHDCDVSVVQLMGSTGEPGNAAESRELVNKMTKTYSGTGYYLNTPLYVDDLYAKEVLLQDPIVHKTFQAMRQCDIILTGLGGFVSASSKNDAQQPTWFGYLVERHIDELKVKGAVGSICAQFFDKYGRHIDCEWNSKCVSMPFQYITKRPSLKVGVVSGAEKVSALMGALNGKLFDVLITDISTVLSVFES